jgi:uncharacterized protein YlxW (UPF0749 family)
MNECTELADEVRRLRERVQELAAKIEDLEQAQDRQRREVEALNAILA